jgi:hypothetical protein
MDPIIDDIPSLVPVDNDLFEPSPREFNGPVITYRDVVLKVPIGPIRAGVRAERVVIRMDLGTINVVTPTISFHGYVRLVAL